jgi:hypothetical protein
MAAYRLVSWLTLLRMYHPFQFGIHQLIHLG